MIGNLKKQYVYEPETGHGTHYVFVSRGKETRLLEIFKALKRHHKGLSDDEKAMIRDLFLMFSSGVEGNEGTTKQELMKFTIGYLFGKYSANTAMEINAENVRITGGPHDES